MIADVDASGVEHVLAVVADGVVVVVSRAWFAAAVAGVSGVAGAAEVGAIGVVACRLAFSAVIVIGDVGDVAGNLLLL